MLPGCVVGDTGDPGDKPRRDLAATPMSLPPASAPTVATPSGSASAAGSARPGGSGSASPGAVASPGSTVSPSAGRPTGGQPAAAPFRPVARLDDRDGDAGVAAAAYGDITTITIEDDGTNARVTVWFAATVPSRLPADEVLGVGVDFYRSIVQTESDYQLFADGQPEGWFAYLHTPTGFVKYPGTFGIGGNRVVFTVPWTALGSTASGTFSGFADWTRAATAGNLYGEDHAPELGSTSWSR